MTPALFRPLSALLTLAASGLAALADPVPPSPPAPRPNIIFILCDDLGPGDIGVLWQNSRPASRRHQTPRLDQFAAEGAILQRHYTAAPVCAPARASFLTGRHQGHATVRDNQFDKALPDQHTVASVLRQAGYATAVIGKWGLQGGTGLPGHPLNRGFDYFFGYLTHQDAHFHYPQESGRPFYENRVDISDRLALAYSTDLLTARAKRWIVDHRAAAPAQPFFLYLSLTAPHAGIRIPTTSHPSASSNYPPGAGLLGGVQWLGDSAPVINTATGTRDAGLHPDYASATDAGVPWTDAARRHATMVRRLDDAVHDLLALLSDLGIDQNTLVVFTSDNGAQNAEGLDNAGLFDPRFFQTFGPYDGIKRDVLEGGVRMPTLVRWPAGIPAGRQDHQPSQFHDWLATFADLAGLPAPAASDGRSLVPALTGSGTLRPGLVYIEYEEGGRTPNWTEFGSANRNRLRREMQAIQLGPYKAVRYDVTSSTTAFRVHDITTDLAERTNLAGQTNVPSQADLQAAVLRVRRADPDAPRPYDTALVPAVPDFVHREGLRREWFPGDHPWVPDYATLAPSGPALTPAPLSLADAPAAPFGARFTGFLSIPASGSYRFKLDSSGPAVVRLHSALLLDADRTHSPSTTADSGLIPLAAGLHPVTIHFLHREGTPRLDFRWSGPGLAEQALPASAWRVLDDTPPPPLVLEAPALWLPLDEAAGTTLRHADTRPFGEVNTGPSDPSPWVPGRHAGALRFDGAARLATVPALGYAPPSGSAPRTLSAWVRPAATQPQLAAWLSYGSTANGRRLSLRIDTTTGSRLFRAEIQGGSLTGSTVLAADQWRHLALVLPDTNGDGSVTLSEARLYLDGQPEPATLAGTTTTLDTGDTFPLTLGGSLHTTGYGFAGDLDDVRLYARALSAAEIAALAARPAALDAWHHAATGDPWPDAADWLAPAASGLPRLLDYALGAGPAGTPPPRPLQLASVSGGGLALSHSLRRSDLAPYSLVLEQSPSLAPDSWTGVSATAQIAPDPARPDCDLLTYPLAAPAPRSFFRHRLVTP
jgi:arylsulfatase A-like enzyme